MPQCSLPCQNVTFSHPVLSFYRTILVSHLRRRKQDIDCDQFASLGLESHTKSPESSSHQLAMVDNVDGPQECDSSSNEVLMVSC